MSEELSKMLVGILVAIILYSMLVMFLLSIVLRELKSLSTAFLSFLEKDKNNDKPLNRRGDRIEQNER